MSAAFKCKQSEIKVKLWPRAKEKSGKIKQAVSRTYRGSTSRPNWLTQHLLFTPRFRLHAGSSNIQGFPPSTSISQTCVRETPVVFVQHKSTRQNTDVSWVSHPLRCAVLAELLWSTRTEVVLLVCSNKLSHRVERWLDGFLQNCSFLEFHCSLVFQIFDEMFRSFSFHVICNSSTSEHTHCMISLLAKSGLENIEDDENSSSVVVSFHYMLSLSPDSIGLPPFPTPSASPLC